MEFAATLAGLVGDHRRLRLVAACAVVLLAIVACILVARGSTEYESMALLLYSGNAVATPGSPPLSATMAAENRLDNAHLQMLMDHFDLYRDQRKGSQDKAAAHMRADMTLQQPDIYSLQLGFRDENLENSQDVTNALAQMLENEVVMGVDAATVGTPAGGRRPRRGSATRDRKSKTEFVAKTESDAEKKARLQKEIVKIDGQLAVLGSTESALQQESALKQEKIASLIHTESATPKPKEPVDPSATARNALKQQIATEKQRLAALRLRYTEAYPDVEETRDRVAALEAKLAALPPPRIEPYQNLYQTQMDEWTAQASELGVQLRHTEEEIAGLHRREDWLKKVVLGLAGQPGVVLSASGPEASGKLGPVLKTVPLKPFRILQTATTSVAIKTSHPMGFLWVGLVTIALLGLCLAPLLPKRDAIITTAELLRASLPTHVRYLGEVKRIES